MKTEFRVLLVTIIDRHEAVLEAELSQLRTEVQAFIKQWLEYQHRIAGRSGPAPDVMVNNLQRRPRIFPGS